MRAGKLRHRITIQQYALGSPQRNASGELDGSWTAYLTVSASVDPVSGREPWLAQAHLSEVSHKVHIRYRAGITHDMRVLYGSRVFEIKAVLNFEERNRELLLLCTEGVSNG